VEESVDELMRKLKEKGAKVKILGNEDDEDEIRDEFGDVTVGLDQEAVRQKEEEMKSALEKNMAELQRLEHERNEYAQNREYIANELEKQQILLDMEQKEKNQLEMMISQMEQKLVSGGSALEAKEREAAQKYREFQNKLKKQRKKQQELEEERKRKEDELINVQK
jgi:CHAT domain-containing protein